eukprot:jgi/Mesen1/6531/ME000333S05834
MFALSQSVQAAKFLNCVSLTESLSCHKKEPASLVSLQRVHSPLCSANISQASHKKVQIITHSSCRTQSVKVQASSSVAASVPETMQAGDALNDDYESEYPEMPLRRAGILMHPTSLPGAYGIGELGEEAYKFIDWLKDVGCTVWQVLPLVPPGRKSGEDGSPYSGQDANCGNTLIISLDELVKEGLLDKSDLPEPVPLGRVDYDAVAALKDPLINKAAKNLVKSQGPLRKELDEYRKDPSISSWLEEAALFAAIDSSLDKEFWWLWPEDVRDRQPEALEKARRDHKDFFLFQKQWAALHKYANEAGIRVIGDMPIYVGGHSADVWANRSQFTLSESGAPAQVSGVPPDYFSKTGQLWGSPLYNWTEMAKDGYKWWANRMRRAFDLYDEFRIDHFRGFAGFWAVPASAETAIDGSWKIGPREGFFEAIKEAVGKVDIIAEDLAINAPGMAVLQFAFGGDSGNPHLPHNHEPNQVVYPGTHDNDTILGWWEKATEKDKARVEKYLGSGTDEIHWLLIRSALASVGGTAIIAIQDVLGLDNSARMNTPAVQKGNWGWRVGEPGFFGNLTEEGERLTGYLRDYNRLPKGFVDKSKAAEEDVEAEEAVEGAEVTEGEESKEEVTAT